MEKLDLADTARFLVSLGVAIMVASLGVPWLLLKDPYDLLLPVDALSKLTPDAQAAIAARQSTLLWVSERLAWIVGIGLSSGIGLVVCGWRHWIPRQALLDEKLRADTENAMRALRTSSPAEVAVKAVEEVSDAVRASLEEKEAEAASSIEDANVPLAFDTQVGATISTEERLLAILAKAVPAGRQFLPRRRLGSQQFDAVAVSLDQAEPDLVIEIAQFEGRVPRLHVAQKASRIAQSTAGYSDQLIRRALPVLIVVVSPAAIPDILSDETNRVLRLQLIRHAPNVLLRFVSSSRLESITAEEAAPLLSLNGRILALA